MAALSSDPMAWRCGAGNDRYGIDTCRWNRDHNRQNRFLAGNGSRVFAQGADSPVIFKASFTGIRPLVLAQPGRKTSQLSRDHALEISQQGLVHD